jgi:hypothetical protein
VKELSLLKAVYAKDRLKYAAPLSVLVTAARYMKNYEVAINNQTNNTTR